LGAGQRIITLDQRGIAASSRGTKALTIDTLAEDCLAVLDVLGSEQVAIVGHSTGGVIAQTMGLMAPGRINGLALTCTWARADRYMHELFRSRRELLRSLPKEYAASMLFIGYPAGWLRDNWQALDAALAGAPLTPSQQDVIAERIAAGGRADLNGRSMGRLRWDAPLDRIGTSTARDTPHGIWRQPRVYPGFKFFALVDRHRIKRRTYASRNRARGPVFLKICKRALHHDLTRLD
jgi:pimeloyl-ACP methyl ester carboxylesterase